MRNVRVFYKKRGALRFVSHLDMNRFMPRLLRRTSIPVWYTEGFNSHIYLNFALPLSLGFESEYEAMDFKVTDDCFSNEMIFDELSAVCPEFIEIINVSEPIFKVGKISFAEFSICFEDNCEIAEPLNSFLSSGSILVQKKSKKGIMKEVELADKINRFAISEKEGTILKIVLSAGADNINPSLLLTAFEKELGRALPDYSVTRTMLYTENMEKFI